jgi:hypothetical protein
MMPVMTTSLASSGGAELDVVESEGAAVAIAMMRRPRTADHEEMWAQLFVDGAFEDVVRALDANPGVALATFVVRFRLAAMYLDGAPHRVSVRFVRTLSQVVPRGIGVSGATTTVQAPEATAEIELVGSSVRILRAARKT